MDSLWVDPGGPDFSGMYRILKKKKKKKKSQCREKEMKGRHHLSNTYLLSMQCARSFARVALLRSQDEPVWQVSLAFLFFQILKADLREAKPCAEVT